MKAGLQLSFAPKVDVDADIDLFQRPFSHLFGEVLVKHLSGNTTSLYRVQDLLEEQNVTSIGGFRVMRTSL